MVKKNRSTETIPLTIEKGGKPERQDPRLASYKLKSLT